jgi:hypothetical protein
MMNFSIIPGSCGNSSCSSAARGLVAERSDHPHGGHDDHRNALALAVALAAQERLRPFAGPMLPEAWRSAYQAPWVSSAPSDSPWGHAPASVAAQPAI